MKNLRVFRFPIRFEWFANYFVELLSSIFILPNLADYYYYYFQHFEIMTKICKIKKIYLSKIKDGSFVSKITIN